MHLKLSAPSAGPSLYPLGCSHQSAARGSLQEGWSECARDHTLICCRVPSKPLPEQAKNEVPVHLMDAALAARAADCSRHLTRMRVCSEKYSLV